MDNAGANQDTVTTKNEIIINSYNIPVITIITI